MERYITWKKENKIVKTLIPENESTMNPDPSGVNAKMLFDGWLSIHIDPIPGITMKYWRPNHRSYYN